MQPASDRAVVKIPGAQIEYDGSEITISTNSAARAGPGSGMPGSDKESTSYQAQAQAQAQARGPQQADDDSTLQGEIQARGRRLVWDRLMEVAAEQFSDPENVSEETVDKIRHEFYAQAQQIVKDLVQQRAQQQQQRQQQYIMMRQQQEQKAAMQDMDGMEDALSEKEGNIQGNKDASQVKDVSSPAVGSSAPVIGSTLNRPQNDISSPTTGQENDEDGLDTFADYFDELEDEILEDENKIQERARKMEDIFKLWENNEPPFHPREADIEFSMFHEPE